LTTDATMAKRKEIAEMIRKDADRLANSGNSVHTMLRYAESLVYDSDDEAAQKAHDMANEYLENLKKLSPEQLNAKADEIKHLRDVCRYLAKFNIIPDDAEPKVQLEEIVKEHGWDKKRQH
ncbi:MAG: hypothetical protein ACREIC_18380, partial [Limisphaerales bacterium]